MKKSAFPTQAKAVARLSLALLALAGCFPAVSQTRLPEVVVTATRFAEPAATLPFGVSVVTAADIQASGVATVNEAVMKLLGVVGRLDTSGGNNYTLDLRGFGVTAESNQVVIVDGLRLNEGDLTSAGLSSIPIASVERIEVLRGTGAVLYGEGTTGGVIVVTTKAGMGAQRKSSAQLYGAAGSMGLREARGAAVISSGGFTIDVAASNRSGEGHRANFASSSDALSVSAQWSNDWLRVGARAGREAISSGLPGDLTAAQFASNPKLAKSLTDYGAIQTRRSGVFAEALVGNWQIVADANQRDKDYDSVIGGAFAYVVGAENYSLRARHEGKLGAIPSVFVIGRDRSSWDRRNLPAGPRADSRSSAWYVKEDITLPSTGTRLSLGWRTESIDKEETRSATTLSDRQNAWELGVSQPVTESVTLYGRTGSSYRLGNVDEFSFTPVGVMLRPQTSRDVELGARWKDAVRAVELRWYRSTLRDEIGFDGVAFANVNFDPTRRQGLELEAQQALSAAFDIRLNAAWRQAKFTAGPFAGNDVMMVPKRTLAVRAEWRPATGHALGAGVQWVSSQRPDFANNCVMPAFATVDLRYAYRWGSAELALGINNLADRSYYTQAFVCAAGTTTAIYPEPGRTLTASLRYQF